MANAKTATMRLAADAAQLTPDTSSPGLVLLYPPGCASQTVFPLGMVTSLGRDEENDIVLASAAVSGRHAVLVLEGGTVTVTDMSSRNGTFVNGRRVQSSLVIQNDNLRVGDVFFKLTHDAPPAPGFALNGHRPGESSEAAAKRMQSGPVGGYQIAQVEQDLANAASNSLNVLLLGETGTGKEVFARFFHEKTGREGPFVAINCAAISPDLVESELFGSVKGAFSGSVRDQRGHFRAAHGGTLFLDELGDMPPEAQKKLLRVVQFREVQPVGSSQAEPVDVRIVCATHADLAGLVRRGGFRADLYNRLTEDIIRLPPLRARREDIYPLTLALLQRHGRPDLTPSTFFMAALLEHPFPGNVRALESVIKRAIARVPKGQTELRAAELTPELRQAMVGYGSPDYKCAVIPEQPADDRITQDLPETWSLPAAGGGDEGKTAPADYPSKETVVGMLAYYKGNVSATARAFGRARTWLKTVMAFYGVDG